MNNKIKVLVIEDEALIAENLKLTLEDLGYAVTNTCYNYTQAIQSIKKRDADLVMLDINLGNKNKWENGLTVAALINSEYPIPFIFLTAYNDLDTIRLATRLQPAGYMIKPVNNAALFATIQTAIENFVNKKQLLVTGKAVEQPEYFFIKIGNKTHKLFWDTIYCIEAGKNYVKLRSLTNKVVYPIRGSLNYVLENLLPVKLTEQFIRINRAISLNQKFITSYDNEYVYSNGEQFENGKTAVKQLKSLTIR